MGKILAIVYAIVIAATASASEQKAPVIDEKTATPSVVIATSAPGESYATPDECNRERVICMRFPIWFRANLIQSVYGDAPKGEIKVTTYSHYGQPEADTPKSPRILLILTSADDHLMPVYADRQVWPRSDGEYFILIEDPYPIQWLPCTAEALRDPVSPAQFSKKARLALDDYAVKQRPELFITTNGYAFPRFGISVSRLHEHLEQLKPKSKDFSCKIHES